MTTSSALRARAVVGDEIGQVFSRDQLLARGCTRSRLKANLDADRWQRVGRAVVTHRGPLTRQERWQAALINCGPRAALASFTAAESFGLRGWEREQIDILVPAGVPTPRVAGLPIRLHHTVFWHDAKLHPTRSSQRLAPALIRAAGNLSAPRLACGLLASAVQQRLVQADELRAALAAATRIRHRALLLAAVNDIEMGAQALSEIDFVRLCRRHRLPPPTQQAVRIEPSGRRRFLDAEWMLRSGRRVAAEVDGAVHLTVARWVDDQLRQNEVVLGGTLMLRFPTVVMRTDEPIVADQLRRALT